jgi:cathepsin D
MLITMFCRASLLFTVTLALFTAASPAKGAGGVSIPLAKRSRLTTPDGVFDLDEATRKTVFTRNKYRQSLINLKRNKGIEAFNEASDSAFPILNANIHATNIC